MSDLRSKADIAQAHSPIAIYEYNGLVEPTPIMSNALTKEDRTVCLRDGFVEGREVAIEYRWAEDQYDRSVVDWNRARPGLGC
jgi:hypothetical protein